MLVALTTRHWLGLVEACGAMEAVRDLEERTGRSLGDEGNRYAVRDEITALLCPWFAAHSFDQVTAALDRARVPWGEYRTISQMATAPDGLVARSAIFEAGPDGYPVARSVVRTSAWQSRSISPPTPTAVEQVLADWSPTKAPVAPGGH
jgi:2-methylfumaryl-CoA isomerase